MNNLLRARALGSALACLCLLTFTPSPVLPAAFAATPAGQVVATASDRPSISREVVGNRKYHVSRVIVNAPPDSVWSVLTNYDKAARIFANVKSLKVLNSDGDHKKLEFSVTSLGGLWSFDYVLAVDENPSEHRIQWHRDSGAFKVNDGFWSLAPADGGARTIVTYAKYIDGGMIPQMMVDSQLRKTMPEVMTNLKSAVESPPRLAQNLK